MLRVTTAVEPQNIRIEFFSYSKRSLKLMAILNICNDAVHSALAMLYFTALVHHNVNSRKDMFKV